MPVYGLDKLRALAERFKQDAVVTAGDLAFAMDNQGARMLDRTAHGMDFEESIFAPYSEKSPYYYYPEGLTGRAAKMHVDHVHKLTKPHGIRTANGIRYKSYGAFKRALGRFVVDLMGPVDPHMLNSIAMEVDGAYSWWRRGSNYDHLNKPGHHAGLEINGEKGKIAAGHNEGVSAKFLPQRKFFAISASDQERMFEDLRKRILARMEGKIGGISVI